MARLSKQARVALKSKTIFTTPHRPKINHPKRDPGSGNCGPSKLNKDNPIQYGSIKPGLYIYVPPGIIGRLRKNHRFNPKHRDHGAVWCTDCGKAIPTFLLQCKDCRDAKNDSKDR